MANLLKPSKCPKCGSKASSRKKKPERWVCDECEHVIVERPQRVFNSAVCIKCGKSRKEVKFRKGRNICVDCHSDYNKEYRGNNQDRMREVKREYWEKKGEELGISGNEARWLYTREIMQQAPENFLKQLASRCRRQSNKEKATANGGNHTNSPIHICDIDYEHLQELYDKQKGRCAITGVPMEHKYGEHATISVDRIDSSEGYLKGNVHLVCQAINYAKKDKSVDSIKEFLDLVIEARDLANA